MTDGQVDVYGGVDTHRDVHVAAAVNTAGQVLGSAPFRADPAGYEQMNNWLQSQGRVCRVGVEGTGSYGAGLTRFLTKIGVEVVEVNRPNRQLRRRWGKTDTTDAEGAAKAALNGQAAATPKSGDGPVEGIRMLRGGSPFGDQSPHPGHQPDSWSGSNRSRAGQTPASGDVGKDPGQDLRWFSSRHS